MDNLGTDMQKAVRCNSTAVGSRFALAIAAVDEAGNRADETKHHAEPDGPEERFNACEHGVSLSAYVRR